VEKAAAAKAASEAAEKAAAEAAEKSAAGAIENVAAEKAASEKDAAAEAAAEKASVEPIVALGANTTETTLSVATVTELSSPTSEGSAQVVESAAPENLEESFDETPSTAALLDASLCFQFDFSSGLITIHLFARLQFKCRQRLCPA
jgi:hypothetical protein